MEYHKIPQSNRLHHQRYAQRVVRRTSRLLNYLINYSQCFCNYPAHSAAGADGSLTACPKGWSAYLLPAAVWQQGHQTEGAFSPSPRLRANAVPLNPSQAAATVHSKPRQEGREGGGEKSGSKGVWYSWWTSPELCDSYHTHHLFCHLSTRL